MENRVEIAEIANEYGYDAQSRQLIEEMAELTQAINKYWRKQLHCGRVPDIIYVPLHTPEEKQIVEEIADVEICLDQLKYILDLETDVAINREYKIARQLQRIRESEATNE